MRSPERLEKEVRLLLILALAAAFSLPSTTVPLVRANPAVIRVPQDFATIQAAVNFASPGDTVLVGNGSYVENVVVTKSLNLTGVSPAGTIIDAGGMGPGINVTGASTVNISGFTVRDTGTFALAGIALFLSSSVTVSGNIIRASAQSSGIFISNSNFTTIRDNILTANLNGIDVERGFGNIIRRNNATGNSVDAVVIVSSSVNKIADNILRKNQYGLELLAGSTGNVLTRNAVSNNTVSGISFTDSNYNLVAENSVEFNSGPNFLGGIRLQNSTGNRFYHDNVLNNTICCPPVFSQVFGVLPGDITANSWDNETGASLITDPRISFVDANNDWFWGYNETVTYDSNMNGVYDTGEPRIGQINGTSTGAPTAAGTPLARDVLLKFIDLNGNGRWDQGEPVVYDVNNNNIFDPSEPAVSGVGGNFWSDYAGLDNGDHGFAGDGIGDTLIPHPCPAGGKPCTQQNGPAGVDWYPLVNQWKPTSLNATAGGTIVSPGFCVQQVQVAFAATASGGIPPYVFAWSFGDGTSSQAQNVTHIYTSKGTYFAVLVVVDKNGISASDTLPVVVLARSGSLALIVRDQSNSPIQGANVTLVVVPAGQRRLSEITNNAGTAAFSTLAGGVYTVLATAPGFVSANKTLTITPCQTVNGQLVLSPPAPIGSPGFPLTLAVGLGVLALLAFAAAFLFLRRRKKGQTGSGERGI